MAPLISLIIPVYRNAENLPSLVVALEALARRIAHFEVVFVVDGSPDDSAERLARVLPTAGFASRLVLLSRNFGSFNAIRAGLAAGEGDFFAVMAADLQEPPELIERFYERLATGEVDVTIGIREGREDGWLDGFFARLFWGFYRRFVVPEVPSGGIDVFGCNRAVRDELLGLEEGSSSLVALLLWVGFRREQIGYRRKVREIGSSAWTFNKKLRYLMDSVYSFSDLPVRLLLFAGLVGVALSLALSLAVLIARISGEINVPGYAATVLTVTFFGGLNCFGLGVIGSYVWRTYENTKGRPNYIVARRMTFEGKRNE